MSVSLRRLRYTGGLSIVLALAALPAACATEVFVATHGEDSNPGTPERPFRTIRKAASIAGPGDTVVIRAGRYKEN